MVEFTNATTKDDADLRKRMRQDIIKGDISISFRREPSFFHGCTVQGDTAQIFKCVDNKKDIIGLGSRFLLNTYINGKSARTGYLSDLRLQSKYRGSRIIFQAYNFLKRCHVVEPVALYYSMILEGNNTALRVLTKSRCNLPCYRDIGRFLTPAIYLDLPKKSVNLPGVSCRRAKETDIHDICQFININAPYKQFTPDISKNDFYTERLRDLKVTDFYIATEDNIIVGVIAAWDQTKFRQTYIEKYNMKLRLLRPLYNFLSTFSRFKPLPSVGSKVPYFYLSFL